MIKNKEEKIKDLVVKYESKTYSSFMRNQSKLLPSYIDDINWVQVYYYKNRSYSYRYTTENSTVNETYGIIKVNGLPFIKLKEEYYMSYLDEMVFNRKIVPILLFVNNVVVKSSSIMVVKNADETYLLLYGDEYNNEELRNSTFRIMVLPFASGYINRGFDYDEYFRFFEAYTEYSKTQFREENGTARANRIMYDDIFTYKNMDYHIGWMLYKYKALDETNNLPLAIKKRLSSINYITGNGSYTYNLLDRDNFDMSYVEQYITRQLGTNANIIFAFDENNKCVLSDYDNYSFAIIKPFENNGDEREDVCYKVIQSNLRMIVDANYYSDTRIDKNNIVIMKNGELHNTDDIDIRLNNSYLYRNYNEDNIMIFTFFINDIENLYSNLSKFNKKYIHKLAGEITRNGLYKRHLEYCEEDLDYQMSDSVLYEENIKNGYEAIKDYDINLLNTMPEVYCYSVNPYSGEELNNKMTYNNKLKMYELNIFREPNSEALIFVNGLLLSTYSYTSVSTLSCKIRVFEKFKNSDRIEILKILNINNNAYHVSDLSTVHKVPTFENATSLKVFLDYPEDLMEYKEIVPYNPKIAYDVTSYKTDSLSAICEPHGIDKSYTVSGTNRFAYQCFNVTMDSYKFLLDSQFKYCHNQKQYMLFINGRRCMDNSFLITIPKYSRPFYGMYLYISKFARVGDRVELIYMPYEVLDINTNQIIEINRNGYIEVDRYMLEAPLDNRLYMMFVNGKKIYQDDIINVSSDTVRLKVDPGTTTHLVINPLYLEYLNDVKDYLSSDNLCLYDKIIDEIKNNPNYGYNELDLLFNTFTQITNTEANTLLARNVANIAIINEIIRDFWVSSGYDYNRNTFVYDYNMDEYFVKQGDMYILPAMDATQDINIIKMQLHHVYFYYDNNRTEEYLEMGSVLEDPIFNWEYNTNPEGVLHSVDKQYFNDLLISNTLRQYQYNGTISKDTSIVLKARYQSLECESRFDFKFVNNIFYGVVDEDLLEHFNTGEEPEIDGEYLTVNDIPTMLNNINKQLNPTGEILLKDYIIGNNNYFIYAAPKRLVVDENGKHLIKFIIPKHITEMDEFKNNVDDKTVPILTNGKFNDDNTLVKLDTFEMRVLTELEFTNSSGYKEPYVVFCTNGYFTRLFENFKFNIHVYFSID